jgi:hypothetical protein
MVEEIPLTGGNSTPGVVRVGDTVRRPLKPRSGFDGAPRYLGIDSKGRAILSFIDGFVPPNNGYTLDEEAVRAGARLLRTVHDLT